MITNFKWLNHEIVVTQGLEEVAKVECATCSIPKSVSNYVLLMLAFNLNTSTVDGQEIKRVS